jgi:hypothetical protein
MSGFSEFEPFDGVALAQMVRQREVSPGELLEASIARVEARNPGANRPTHGNDFVLLGIEDLSYRKVAAFYPQAWWCQVRADLASRPVPFDDGDVV